MAAMATPLIAMGRKMSVFETRSPPPLSRSASTATARPRTTTKVGTIVIQSSVLTSVIWKSFSPIRSV